MPAVSARMGEDAQFSQEWPQARGQGLRRAASAFLIEQIPAGLLVQDFGNIVAAVPIGDAAIATGVSKSSIAAGLGDVTPKVSCACISGGKAAMVSFAQAQNVCNIMTHLFNA